MRTHVKENRELFIKKFTIHIMDKVSEYRIENRKQNKQKYMDESEHNLIDMFPLFISSLQKGK